MREFNTSGPCNPELHYMLRREKLLAKGLEKVEKGRFFTIFAPRQSGKTTYFQLLFAEFAESSLKPVHIRFASLKEFTKEDFYKALDRRLKRELQKHGIVLKLTVENADHIEIVFENILKDYSYYILLVIDEFEGIPDCVLNEFMHVLRDMYHQKENHSLQSMILVGVSTISKLVHTSASPFNVAEQIEIPYFSESETNELIDQYVSESGQDFDNDTRKAIWFNTNGQPGLVCALCQHLVTEVAIDRTKPVCTDDFYPTLNYFLTERYDKNIINIVQKAMEKKDFMIRLLFSEEPLNFSVYDDNISFMYSNGVIDNLNGTADISVPLYKKCLLTAMRPKINGETSHFLSDEKDNFNSLKTKDGLNIKGLLQKYTAYVKRRGFKAFDTENLKESAWHYSLDGYINFVVEDLKGHTFIEVPSGRGRTDIMIVYGKNKYVIETKVYSSQQRFEDGKVQLAQYLKSEGLSEGFYVVFSNRISDDVAYLEETIEGLKIHTFIIRIKYDIPSNIAVIQRQREKLSERIFIEIETMLADMNTLKEDIEDGRKLLQKKDIDNDEIDIIIKNIKRVEDAIKEIELSLKQNQNPSIGALKRFTIFFSNLTDENSDIAKVLKGLTDGKRYSESLIESCNKIKESLKD